ncbi:response regulator [Telluribacter sp. SYSU D00476]|uniref:response regulator n=1 Tax=Telluribacter sp. SYSU D00476 TaxID=2811430 RepID=UPI001FF3E706|nr:response regulator [Telluribacter sp. SYSU D00476]
MPNPITCLLIDDDQDDQEIFALALNKVDPTIHCVTADDGLDALQKLNRNSDFVPEYIFLDLNMPRMNGKQCLTELKKIERLDQTPIIIYSTSSEPRDILETKQLGATDFMTKPSFIDALTASLAKVFVDYPTS